MTRRTFKSFLPWAIGLFAALVTCGAGADAPASAKDGASKAKSFEREHSDAHSMHSANGFGRRSKETLLIGTSNQTIVQVDPKSGHLMATLTVPTLPTHIVADETNIYFGSSLGRYDLATHEVVNFAFSDGFTGAVAMAISPGGTLFASNMYYFRPDTSCGTCSTLVAYPDPNGMNPEGRINYFYGYVRPLPGGEGVLSGQQIGFTDEAKLLVTSKAGDGIFVSDAPVAEVCCGPTNIAFTALVADDTHTTLRFALRGDKHLLVLHSTGSLDEHDLATGRLVRPLLQAGTLDPLDLVVGHDGTLYVLEKSGQVRVFSEHGRELGRITLPAAAGQAVSMALCCGAPTHAKHRR
jgi:hypothetical protein